MRSYDIATAMTLWILADHSQQGVPPKYDVEPLRKLVFAGLPLELYEFLSRGHRNNKKTHHKVSFFVIGGPNEI